MKSISRCWSIVGLLALLLVLTACSGPVTAQEGQFDVPPISLPVPGLQTDTPGLVSDPDSASALARLQNYDSRRTFQTTRIYDRRGKLLDEVYGEGRRTWVPLDEIPEALKQATIATEDKTFYSNTGIDPLAIGRAFWQNVQAGAVVSGGSTITQQLVRLIVFPYEQRIQQTISRKVNESLLATRLTQMWSKDKILETYLNEIYYGHRAYGVAAAAETYFDKPVSELTLAESSLLAGLPQAPSRLDPHKNLEGAKQRQAQVLRLMVEAGYITQAEADAAYEEELTLKLPERVRQASHFVDYVLQVLEDAYGLDTVRQGGLRVTTTLDLRYQRLAEEIARRHVEKMRDKHNLTNASVIVMQPQTGQILAMVGSVDYSDASIDGQVNVALRPRQPGSAIKAITYATAFEQGFTPATVVWDIPTTFPLEDGRTYQPTNYDKRFHGPLRVRDALANSYNVPAVQVLDAIGVQALVDKAHAMGVTGLQRDPQRYYGLALTLGGGEISLLDLTTAYATLANAGGYVPPAPILKVVDGTGETIYEYRRPEPKPAVDPAAAFLVTDILADDAARQPAFGHNNLLDLNRPAAVKTGTTSDWRDAWTIGYTPYITVGVWAGNADNTPMNRLPGSRGAAPIWRELIESILRLPSLHDVLMVDGQPLKDGFEPPMGIVQAEICDLKTLRTGQGCGQRRLEYFVEGTIPAEGDEAYALRKLAEETFIETGAILGITSAEWHISSPGPGELITTTVPIIGTALFNPAEVSFFKVEFASARAPMTWITMGQTHTTPVEDGQLEVWHAGGLDPSSYTLRLVLVKPDGNWLPPYDVPVRVER
ncbi:MAG: transglycosylase domain-containing protein [Anaerolineae bacterium]